MASLSLLFELSQDSNMMPFTDVYSTPGLLGNLSSVSTGTTTVSPSTPLDSSLLSLANFTYGLNGTLCALGGPVTPEASAYMQLARCYQQMKRELIKEKEECVSLK
jgi:hypothetical protein